MVVKFLLVKDSGQECKCRRGGASRGGRVAQPDDQAAGDARAEIK